MEFLLDHNVWIAFAMLTALDQVRDPFAIFNLGTDESCRVVDSIGWITVSPNTRDSFI